VKIDLSLCRIRREIRRFIVDSKCHAHSPAVVGNANSGMQTDTNKNPFNMVFPTSQLSFRHL
jgi:hypothetical protein